MGRSTTEPSRANGGIFLRTTMLSVLVAILTSAALVVGIVIHEQKLLRRQTEERAGVLAASIRGVTGSFVREDYADVTEHCMSMVNSSEGVRFAVVTRSEDGFSLVHEPGDLWGDRVLDKPWRPTETIMRVSIGESELADGERVMLCSYPFEYKGIHWGWIHVGLSLEAHEANTKKVFGIVGLISLPALALGIISSFLFARNLTRPILKLKHFAERVAGGDLDGRAGVDSRDELGSLAMAMNNMTTDLKESQLRLAEAARQEAAMREIVVKEIHHRVKNNMQILSSLMRMQGRAQESDQLRAILRDGEARIRSMGLIHEKLYQSESLSDIDFQGYTESLTSQLFSVLGEGAVGIQCEVEAQGVMLPLDTALPCGLIINELFSNSLKYAFPDGGPGLVKIRVEKVGDGGYRMEVSDDGRGLPPKEERRKGSLGMNLVEMLADQLDGDVEIESMPGVGVKTVIHFKVSLYTKRV